MGNTAVVIVSHQSEERGKSIVTQDLLAALKSSGAVLVVFVGPHSERYHDELDRILETKNDIGVVTTWHASDEFDDVCYMLAGWPELSHILLVTDLSTETGRSSLKALNALGTILPDYVVRMHQ